MIEFEGVTRKFGKTVAVASLTLSVPRGELFALLGPNGAGKTTTIRMLVGLLEPDSGTLRVCGREVTGPHPRPSACLGFVPEEPFLYDKLTGREFLEFAGEMHGLDRDAIGRQIDRETGRFELADFLDDLTETYSHGMKQRLVFASALIHDPTVLVVDEPMVGLDPHSVRVVKDLLRSHAAAGNTVFMSTHTLGVVEEIADRIGVLQRGQLRFVGSLAQMRRELASPDAALEPLFLELTGGNGQAHGNGESHRGNAPLHREATDA